VFELRAAREGNQRATPDRATEHTEFRTEASLGQIRSVR